MATLVGSGSTSSTGSAFTPDFCSVGVLSKIVTLATGDLSAQSHTLGYLPTGARVIDVVMTATDMDSNGSPTLVMEVGDSGDVDRFIDASTIGQTGGTIRAGNVAASAATFAAHTAYTSRTQMVLNIATGAATAVAGTAHVTILYVVDEPLTGY